MHLVVASYLKGQVLLFSQLLGSFSSLLRSQTQCLQVQRQHDPGMSCALLRPVFSFQEHTGKSGERIF